MAQGDPKTVAKALMEGIARTFREDEQLDVLWATSGRAVSLECLGDRLKQVTPGQLLATAQACAEQGRYPLMILSSRSLPQVFGRLLHGLPHFGTLIFLGGGLTFSLRESHLHPARLRDLALLRQVAGLAVTVPADEDDALQLLQMSRFTETPLAIRLTGATWVPVKRDYSQVPPGGALRVRDGKDLAILAMGSTVLPSLLAAEALSTWGFETSVYAMRFLRPLDAASLREALQCQLVLTVEEHCLQGGLHTAVLETIHQILEPGLVAKVRGLGLPGHPAIDVGAAPEQFQLDAEGIQRACLQLLGVPEPALS